jgi:oxalate decarboxylase/phosphoglucose isomerase-like protein (cupin superfamily)
LHVKELAVAASDRPRLVGWAAGGKLVAVSYLNLNHTFGNHTMERISRRNVLGVAAAALASGVLAEQAGLAAAGQGAGDAPADASESTFKFSLSKAKRRTYGDSSVCEHKLKDFPISTNLSGSILRLAPGDFREPHWHPNSDEYVFVMSGKLRMTIVDAKGEASHITCEPEDVALVPVGFGHYLETVSDKESVSFVIHNNAEYTTIDLSQWVAGGSLAVFASTLNMPVAAFDTAPKKRVYITKKKAK